MKCSSKGFIVGTCMEMCPKFEVEMREREKLLHHFEILPSSENNRIPRANAKYMVKSFSRSAAGKNMEVPENIRPPHILLKTIDYLFHDIVGKEDASWVMKYDFIMDRLRAIRQDLIIQNGSAADYITILQPMIRFYAYSSYRLCEENINTYDPYINNTHLQECLKRLLYAYDDLCEVRDNDEVYINKFLDENRPYFESLYIVLNLGHNVAMMRGLKLPKMWKTELVKLSLHISLAYMNNNFLRVCTLFKKLPALHASLVYLQLPDLRRHAFKIMSVAYSSKNLTFPQACLSNMLLYDSIEDLRQDCQYYGLKISETGVCFSKADFDNTKDTVPPKKSHLIDQQFDETDINEILLFNMFTH